MSSTKAAMKSTRNRKCLAAAIFLVLVDLLASGASACGQAKNPDQSVPHGESMTDWVTALPRQPIHVDAWPGNKKVAVCFVLYVEVWGYGQGPNFRTDMNGRDPDVVDEAFRQYAINWGIPRLGRMFHDEGVPLSIALNAQFPQQRPEVWKQFRTLVPAAPIIAHGINNSNRWGAGSTRRRRISAGRST
jgi:hypothetical protein